MLFLVEMDGRIPHDADADQVGRLQVEEKKRSQELQHSRKRVHLWPVAGRYANVSVFDVDTHELHETVASLPLFPYLDVQGMPLATHPSALRPT